MEYKLKEDVVLKKWQAIVTIIITLFSVFASIVFAFSTLKGNVEAHVKDNNIHMSYAQSVKEFTTRPEYEAFKSDTNRQLQEIKDDLKEMKRDIKKLLERR